ncbi:hypothetical protein CLM62_38720 [Streptomyces sp. SA15]|nr:hypothetical protein CLM62_38720 [Streptomyces sp. SA15]
MTCKVPCTRALRVTAANALAADQPEGVLGIIATSTGTRCGPKLTIGLKLTIIVDIWVSDHSGDPHVGFHPHHPAAWP